MEPIKSDNMKPKKGDIETTKSYNIESKNAKIWSQQIQQYGTSKYDNMKP